MAQPFPFVGAAYSARSKALDAQRCINLYPEVSESGPGPSKGAVPSGVPGRSVCIALIGAPGRVLWATMAGGAVRGLRRFSASVAVAVVGGNVYRLTTGGAATLIGSAPDDGRPVAMDSNGSIVIIATSIGSVAVDPMTGATAVLGISASSVGFIDGRMLLNKVDTGQFVYTGLYNSVISPLNFETAEGAPDNLLALAISHREVWLFGEYTTEVFAPTGDSLIPFGRVGNAFVEVGIAAPSSIGEMDSSLYWLSADERGQGMVMRASGFEPQRVSTHAVEYAIGSYSRIDDAIAYTYQQEGHNFYVLTFPSAGKTWVFDSKTSLWHERAYRRSDGGLEQVREQCQMMFAGKILVGDRLNGNVYSLDLNTFTDNGDAILRLRACPHLSSFQVQQTFYSLEVTMETGVGDGSLGQGGDPQCRLRWSDDGGQSFGATERIAPLGKLGERNRRVRFRRLGSARDRVFEWSMTDPVKCVITGAVANVISGSN